MTNPINSFTTLVSAVVDYFEDDSSEFKAYIPVAIDLAEQRLTREIDSVKLRQNTNVSCATSGNTITKPEGYKLGFNLRYVKPTGETLVLKKTTDSYIEDYWPWGTTSVGCPKYYADYSGTQFIIGPTCSNAGDFKLSYLGRPTALTAAVSTNVFTSAFSDLLFHSTLIYQAEFARHFTMLDKLKEDYNTALQSIVNDTRRERRDSGIEPANAQGNQNTLNATLQPE